MAQMPPNWLYPMQRTQNYPEKEYYTGFVSLTVDKSENVNEYIDKLKSAARTALSESIFVSVKSTATVDMKNSNGKSDDRYQRSTITRSSLEAIGLETEIYWDEKRHVAYGFAWVKKKPLIIHYFNKMSDELVRIKSALILIEQEKDKAEAYKKLMMELQALDVVKEYQDMLRYLDVTNQSVLMVDTWKLYYNITHDELHKIRSSDDVGINEACVFLVDKLREDMKGGGTNGQPIKMGVITYKSSGIPTEFSEFFGQKLYQTLEGGLSQLTRGISSDGYVLSGTYWPGEDQVQLIININYMENGEVVWLKSGSSIAIKKSVIEKLHLEYNLAESKELLKKNEIMQPVAAKGGLVASVATQKGDHSVIFKEGEMLNLFVNLSRPSYIRVINIWSDDQKFLLADNLKIDQTNLPVKLSLAWETACPCGVEYIQLIAQDKPFEPLETKVVDGFMQITANLEEILESNRGFKEGQDGLYAESTIVLTTIP
jgi:hypothetical protein